MKMYLLFIEGGDYDAYHKTLLGVYSSPESRELHKEQYLEDVNYHFDNYEEFTEEDWDIDHRVLQPEILEFLYQDAERMAHLWNDHGLWKKYRR